MNEWRKEHAEKLKERKEYFEPQVLRIEDDEGDGVVETLSDVEETLSEAEWAVGGAEGPEFKQSFDYEVEGGEGQVERSGSDSGGTRLATGLLKWEFVFEVLF